MNDGDAHGERLTRRSTDAGAIWRLTMGGSTGNVLDAALVDALVAAFTQARDDRHAKAIVLEGAGPHFSYGASVQEHLPRDAARMLTRLRSLLYAVLDCRVTVLAAVRGRCLGGGLELCCLAHRTFASRDAAFGQPEIALGVFAPFASVLLPERIGRTHAEDLCLTGRTITADEACRLGLVGEVVEGDPADAAVLWARTHLIPRSAASLRHAVEAVRSGLVRRLRQELPGLERQYVDRLMKTSDAVEGLQAFLDKRSPRWRDQ